MYFSWKCFFATSMTTISVVNNLTKFCYMPCYVMNSSQIGPLYHHFQNHYHFLHHFPSRCCLDRGSVCSCRVWRQLLAWQTLAAIPQGQGSFLPQSKDTCPKPLVWRRASNPHRWKPAPETMKVRRCFKFEELSMCYESQLSSRGCISNSVSKGFVLGMKTGSILVRDLSFNRA